jgi:hypothetical protein
MFSVIPGRRSAPDPESRYTFWGLLLDSGFALTRAPE